MRTVTIDNPVDEAKRLLRAGRPREAQVLCDAMLRQRSQWPEALHLLGLTLAYEGRLTRAIALLRRSVDLCPSVVEFHVNLAQVLLRAGRREEARRSALIASRDPAAIRSETLAHLGDCLLKLDDVDGAEAAFGRALASDPHSTAAHCGLGRVLTAREQFEAAELTLTHAAERDPPAVTPYEALITLYERWGDARGLVRAYDGYLVRRPGDTAMCSNMLFAACHDDSLERADLLERHRAFQRHAPPGGRPGPGAAFENVPDPERRLRVGYVSADFRGHTRGRFLEPLLAAHDRRRFEVVCYSDVASPDAVTGRIRACADGWHEVRAFDDEALARVVRTDRIDVLVELTGHMAGNRLGLFARRPAPLQLSYPGYPHSTGLDAIDYCLVDWDRAPAGAEAHYVEQLYRLERPSQCYRPFPDDMDVSPLPAAAGGGVTFGCFCRAIKVTPVTADLWARVLERCPDARLLLVGTTGRPSRHLCDALRRHGLQERRVTVVPPRGPEAYMRLYAQVDIGLDTYPYGGHSTTLDAAWMGVPTVTLCGPAHASREGAAVNRVLGLPHLVAETGDEYVDRAARLASDRAQLAELRGQLRPRVRASPLGDGGSLARSVELAYRDVWRTWCAARQRPDVRGSDRVELTVGQT